MTGVQSGSRSPSLVRTRSSPPAAAACWRLRQLANSSGRGCGRVAQITGLAVGTRAPPYLARTSLRKRLSGRRMEGDCGLQARCSGERPARTRGCPGGRMAWPAVGHAAPATLELCHPFKNLPKVETGTRGQQTALAAGAGLPPDTACHLMFSPYSAAVLVVVKPQRGRGRRDVMVDSAARLRRAGIARGDPEDPRHIWSHACQRC